MSDADDQMGGTKEGTVESGRRAREVPKEARSKAARSKEDRESEESFPASDPPGNY